MSIQHKKLASGRWFEMAFVEQMANIGSEVERAISWREKKKEYSIKAIERALELLSLTINDERNRARLKELTRLHEVLVDYFYYNNQYASSDILWHKYFYNFNYISRVSR